MDYEDIAREFSLDCYEVKRRVYGKMEKQWNKKYKGSKTDIPVVERFDMECHGTMNRYSVKVTFVPGKDGFAKKGTGRWNMNSYMPSGSGKAYLFFGSSSEDNFPVRVLKIYGHLVSRFAERGGKEFVQNDLEGCAMSYYEKDGENRMAMFTKEGVILGEAVCKWYYVAKTYLPFSMLSESQMSFYKALYLETDIMHANGCGSIYVDSVWNGKLNQTK